MMLKLCTDIIKEGSYRGIDAEMAARGLAALTEGLWLDMLVNPRKMSRKKALKISMSYLSHLFPDHFPGDGEGNLK